MPFGTYSYRYIVQQFVVGILRVAAYQLKDPDLLLFFLIEQDYYISVLYRSPAQELLNSLRYYFYKIGYLYKKNPFRWNKNQRNALGIEEEKLPQVPGAGY